MPSSHLLSDSLLKDHSRNMRQRECLPNISTCRRKNQNTHDQHRSIRRNNTFSCVIQTAYIVCFCIAEKRKTKKNKTSLSWWQLLFLSLTFKNEAQNKSFVERNYKRINKDDKRRKFEKENVM